MRERGEEEIRRIRGKEEKRKKRKCQKKLSKIFRKFGGFYRTKYISEKE